MNKIKIKAPAKINLTLDVIGKRKDGYHNIETIFQEISLFDKMLIKKIPKGIKLHVKPGNLKISVKKNLCYKAAEIFLEENNIKEGVEIFLKKNIPIGAGLGGGSSDAAGVLKGLNLLFKSRLSNNKLEKLARKLGMDVPFFIKGGCAYATGRGEELQNIKTSKSFWLILMKPKFSVSTKEAYELIDKNLILTKKCSYAKIMLQAIRNKKETKIPDILYNIFEKVVSIKYPGFPDGVKQELIDAGAKGSLMSGSGSAVFGIFRERRAAYRAFKKMSRTREEKVYLAKTLQQGWR